MRTYILSGILHCGNCGSKMIGVCEGKKGNWTGYRCKRKAHNGTNACNMINVNALHIEGAVFKDVTQLFLIPQNVRIIFQKIKEKSDKVEASIQKELGDFEAEIKKLEEVLNRYTTAFESGLLDAKYFSQRNNSLKKAKEKYEKKRNILLHKIEDVKYDDIYFYQFKKYLYNIKLASENIIIKDVMMKTIILRMLIQANIIKNITILNPHLAKINYNIGNQKIEKTINYKLPARSNNTISIKQVI